MTRHWALRPARHFLARVEVVVPFGMRVHLRHFGAEDDVIVERGAQLVVGGEASGADRGVEECDEAGALLVGDVESAVRLRSVAKPPSSSV